jgi:hypothetical protein
VLCLLLLLLLLLQFTTAQALVHITRAAYLATTLLSVLSTLQGFVGGFTRPMPATPVVSHSGLLLALLVVMRLQACQAAHSTSQPIF